MSSETMENQAVEKFSSLPDRSERLAIFDLDGTLTTRDSFLAFLLTFGRRNARYASLARTPFRLAAYVARLTHDNAVKQALIRDYFASVEEGLVTEHAEWFCKNWLPRAIHPVGRCLLDAHQSRGDRIILLSASPEIFVPSVAAWFGIEEVVCTMVVREAGRWTGPLKGENCKGRNKVTALTSYLGVRQAPRESFAYGDSKSDRFVLEWARYGAYVRRDRIEPFRIDTCDAFPLSF